MPSETEQLKVEVSLTNENKIVIIADHKEFQKYATTNDQNDIRTTFCMLDDELLRIQINNGSHQEESTNQLEVKSVSTIKGNDGWKEEKEVKELFGFCEAEKNKEIEIFKSPAFRLKKLINEKRELQAQLDTANKEKTALEEAKNAAEQKNTELETAKQKVEQEKTNLQDQLAQAKDKIKELETENQQKDKQIAKLNDGNGLAKELGEKTKQIEELNAQIETLKQDLETEKQKVQQLQKQNKELEAKKQPTEQSEAPTYTAAVGFGLAAGLAAFIALERTVRLDIWATVGIALVAALAVSGGTYLALKPSTQVNEAEAQEVNNNALEKQPA